MEMVLMAKGYVTEKERLAAWQKVELGEGAEVALIE
jgi:hypothetical protein